MPRTNATISPYLIKARRTYEEVLLARAGSNGQAKARGAADASYGAKQPRPGAADDQHQA
jgi:hypothetical protein